MSLLTIGTVAFDAIETPFGKRQNSWWCGSIGLSALTM